MLVVLSGPSASGKDAIAHRLIEEHPGDVSFAITATTRQPRPGELDGEHYHFLTPEQFAALETGGELLESATVYGLRYGVPRASVRAALERTPIALVRTDVQGADSISALIPQALLIFITAPDVPTLERRMRTRGGMNEGAIARRLDEARAEINRANDFAHTVTNEDGRLADAVEETWNIIHRESQDSQRRIPNL